MAAFGVGNLKQQLGKVLQVVKKIVARTSSAIVFTCLFRLENARLLSKLIMATFTFHTSSSAVTVCLLQAVQEALDAAMSGRSCITIAHRLSTVRHAGLICVMSGGRVAETGTHAHLMDLKGLYYELHNSPP